MQGARTARSPCRFRVVSGAMRAMVGRDLSFGARASMEPVIVELRYRPIDGGDSVGADATFQTSWQDAFIACEASFDGEIIDVSVLPKSPLRIESVRVVFRHAFASDEMVLLNGYQSWTGAAEHPAWAHAHFLKNMANRLVRRQLSGGNAADTRLGDAEVLAKGAQKGKEASGTLSGHRGRIAQKRMPSSSPYAYASISDQNDESGLFWAPAEGEGHGFTYGTFRRGEGVVLVGSLDESHGFTRIDVHLSRGAVTLSTECPEKTLRAGFPVSLGRYAVVRGAARQCYERWLKLCEIAPRPAEMLLSYTSRHLQGNAIGSAKLLADLTSASAFFESLPEQIAEGADEAFLIESPYCIVGDWLDYDRMRFPEGLASIARAARTAGLLPGIWVAPFVCHRDSRLFDEYPEWLLRDENGDPIAVGSNRDGVYALDTLNVDVRSYVLEVLQTMTCEWGFRLIVADCLFAACLRAHGGRNQGELMADAIDLIRLGVGDDVAVMACGVPLASAFGKVEYCRIGRDMGPHWPGDSRPRMFGHAQARNVASEMSAQSLLDGRAFGIDWDAVFEAGVAGVAGAQGARGIEAFVAAGNGVSVLLASDDMGSWGTDVRERFINVLSAVSEGGVRNGGGR